MPEKMYFRFGVREFYEMEKTGYGSTKENARLL